jgi:hypothetical protein
MGAYLVGSMAYFVVKDFFQEADQMRASIDQHFDSPGKHQPATHQIWNYWYVPQSYTYMRTTPGKLIPETLMIQFMGALQAWCLENLGMSEVSYPYLSLYVNGCGQALHNDAENGRWAYVYSLTNWENRHFSGGETILFAQNNPYLSGAVLKAGAGTNFYDLVPPAFNQLLIFDDRMIHGVERLAGTMNPFDGRLVLHGHITENGIHIGGALAYKDVAPMLAFSQREIVSKLQTIGHSGRGIITVRMRILPTGIVEQVEILSELISYMDESTKKEVCEQIFQNLQSLRFPAKRGNSQVILPIHLLSSGQIT